MRLEPFYRVTFTTPESWTVTRPGGDGAATAAEGQSFLIAEGRAEGRPSARYRAANYPRRRADGAGFDVILDVSLMVWEPVSA